ncbi:PfkB family carbohydrate kinase [Methylotenera sp.]|uniref:PfkB family carbohydrate kinase n=1 Tax=Methylotenera sp. TaxID=2051956 RepID=UPI0027343DB2|nr:PfkB family carbohydrate kinase [Methylotenera sp.]MDP3777626.1 PfkB family carbohydrate kinase [Methylotenera sp.]
MKTMKSDEIQKDNPFQPKILGTGLIALDIVLDSHDRLLGYGLGGSAGNVLSILASLGWSSSPIGKLGCDLAADIIIEEFKSLNANLELIVQDYGDSTPVIYQHQIEDGNGKTHMFSFACPICGKKRPWHAPNIQFPPRELLDTVKPNVIYMDRATLIGIEIAEYYKNKDVLVFFEPSTVGDDTELFRRALNVADMVKYADDRLGDLETYDRSHIFVEICTMGRDGLRYRAPSLNKEWVHLDAFSAPEVVDTSGAGDWCTSGMLYHLFQSDINCTITKIDYNNLNRALRFGQALSALNCMATGARGLAKALSKSKIHKLAENLQKTKLDNGLFGSGLEAHSILREGWANLISSRLNQSPSISSSGNRVCCHTHL